MTRVADYIGRYVKALDCPVFAVTGGGSIHLTDGMHMAGVNLIFCHHEQACAMAAEGYAKTSGRIGVCCVTTGCGGTNALTGILSAYQDSAPVLALSGQVKRRNAIGSSGLRQHGVQEANILPMVIPVTKYAVAVKEPTAVAYDLERAMATAMAHRRGPVWLDVPLDVQTAEVDEALLGHYTPPPGYGRGLDLERVEQAKALLSTATKPIVIVGQGVRLAGACAEFREFVDSYGLPFVASWLGIDVMPTDHPGYVGRLGRGGDVANAAVHGADVVLAIGSRLSMATCRYEPENLAPNAKMIVVDVDTAEHRKPGERVDLFINADAGEFLRAMRGAT